MCLRGPDATRGPSATLLHLCRRHALSLDWPPPASSVTVLAISLCPTPPTCCAPPTSCCPQLKSTTRQVAVSTASMGKFDRMVQGERPEDRKPASAKRRKFLPVADKVGGRRGGQLARGEVGDD